VFFFVFAEIFSKKKEKKAKKNFKKTKKKEKKAKKNFKKCMHLFSFFLYLQT